MSYILPGKEEDLNFTFTNLLLLRIEILEAFSYQKLLEFSRDELIQFISGARNSPGKEWPALQNFLMLSFEDRQQMKIDIFQNPENVELPGIKLDTLLELTTFSAEERADFRVKILHCVRDTTEALNLEKLLNSVRSAAHIKASEISKSTAYEAVLSTCQRLNKLTTSMMYLKHWLNAHAGTDTGTSMVHGASCLSYDCAPVEDGRALQDVLGEDDSQLTAMEHAEVSLQIIAASLEALKKLGKQRQFSRRTQEYNLVDFLETTAEKMSFAFKHQDFLAVQESFENVLEIVEKVSKEISRNDRLKFQNLVTKKASGLSL